MPVSNTTTMITPTVQLWLISAALLVLGVTAHYRITTQPHTDGLGIIRYLGVFCGTIGVLGIPLANAVNPYITDVTPIEATITVTLTILISAVISHYGWLHLGTHDHDVAQNNAS